MKLTWLGHASFLLETDGGTRLLTDPYPQNIYPHPVPECDFVTLSHEHYDHNHVEDLPGSPVILRRQEGLCLGKKIACGDITLTAYPSFHDEVQGAKRGWNVVCVFEADGVRIAHMGDIGHDLTPELTNALEGLDALLLPVGGTYTVDGAQAAEIAKALRPRHIVPMHYALPGCPLDISPVAPFLVAMGDAHVCTVPALTFDRPAGIVLLEKRG